MPWFIKTERFTEKTLKLRPEVRKKYLSEHQKWVVNLDDLGIVLSSGFLVNENQKAGGGGLLIIKANSFEIAKELVEQDPMIRAGLVDWKLEEWIPVHGNILI